MKKIYQLDDKDFDQLKFKCHFITDRQNLIEEQKLRNQGLKSIMFDRLDMFWIDVTLYDEDLGSASVDPHPVSNMYYIISKNSCKVDRESWLIIRNLLFTWFAEQPEYKKQMEWMQSLIDVGYTSSPGEICPICKHSFVILEKHLHRRFEDKIYPFHHTDTLWGQQEILDEKGVSMNLTESEWRECEKAR